MSDVETDPTELAETAGRRLPRVRAALVGIAFVAAALAITVLAPTERQTNSPFVTAATQLDRKVTVRGFTLTMTDVVLADRLTAADWVGETDGVWLVIDMVYVGRLDPANMVGTMTIGDADYRQTERLDTAGLATTYSDPGLPLSGTMAFELPLSVLADADSNQAVVQFAMQTDARLDGVVQATFDLHDLEHVSSQVIDEPGRVSG